MPTVSIRIPQIGEGLQEARVVAFLKQPGDSIERDEPIYQMETDKAVMDVESPNEGKLLEWLAAPDDMVAIGAEIARIELSSSDVAGQAAETPPVAIVSPPKAEEISNSRVVISPRTRAYAKEKGISDENLNQLGKANPKLAPADIDAFIGIRRPSREYTDALMSSNQRILNSRLSRAAQLVVPGTITVALDWEGVTRERSRVKKSNDELKPTSFTMFAFGVAQAAKEHPKFRTSLVGEDTFRTYKTLSLGIAVSLPNDELVLAVVENADCLTWPEFATSLKTQIDLARTGKDQAHEAVTLSLTNMQNFGLRHAVPVVVPPAAATLFLGEAYLTAHEDEGQLITRLTSNIALTFDHRVMNGVGAAQFMVTVKKNVEHVERLLAL
jgi:pyruvate/2-oxoglutarate dehydrogenase complex dihydrolipoamide acyltransferase (E2) component